MSFSEAKKIKDPYEIENQIWEEHGFVQDLMALYQRFPDVWSKRFLGLSTWERQREFMRAVAANQRTTVRSGHGVGKSYGTAALVLWYFTCFPGSRVVTTAPTGRQVKEILWSAIEKLHIRLRQNVARAGECLKTMKVRDPDDPEHYAIGFTTDEEQAFQGIHAGNMLVVFDEACGIPKSIYDSAEGLLTSKDNKVLLIGNPIEPNTYFHETHTRAVPGYHIIKISSYESPNIGVDKEGKYCAIEPEPYPGLCSMAWINQQLRRHGPGSPWVVARIYGEFPKTSEYQLIDDESIAAAIAKGIFLRNILKKAQLGKEVVSAEDIRKLSTGSKE
jgi:hypothetical protein